MLSTALQNHNEVCAHGEVLNDRDDQILEFFGLNYHAPGAIIDILRAELWRSPANFLDKFVLQAGRFPAVGFKFKYEEMNSPLFGDARAYVLRNTRIKIIHMTRENIWERFLSEYIAINVTGEFNSTDEAILIPAKKIYIPIPTIAAALTKTLSLQTHMSKLFDRHQTLSVTYEEFTRDPASAFKKVTDFLGVTSMNFTPTTKKIRSALPVQEMVENYSEIQRAFARTEFESMFSQT